MEGSSNSLGSGGGLATAVAKPGMQHGASSKAKSLTSMPARSGTGAGAAEASLGDTADPISIHHLPPPPPSQLTTSGADAEAPHVVLGGRGPAGGSTVTSFATPVASDGPVAVRSGMYPSSRRQGGAAASVGARSMLPRAGASSAAMPAAYCGGEDANGESSAPNTGYYYSKYYGSDQASYYSSSTYGYYNNQGEYPGGGGGSSGSTNMPYGSTSGPMAGSTSSGAGASDGQSVPVYSFPYQPSSSATANPQQHPNQPPAQYQQSQRQQPPQPPQPPPPPPQQQQSQHSPQHQSPYSPQMPATEQGSSAYQSYYQQTYQPPQQPRPQQLPITASTSQSLGGESQYYGYYYRSGSDPRRGHARTASGGSGAHYYSSQQQQQQHGYPPSSSGEGEALCNQGSNMQSSSQGGATEGYYQQYAQCPAYSFQGSPPSAQQQHSSYMGGEGQNSSVSASYGLAVHAASRGSQPCSTTTSAYGGESDATQGTSAARYAGGAYGQPDNAGSNMNGSEGGGVGGRGYGSSTAAAAAGNGGAGAGGGSASGGYYGVAYSSGYSAPAPHASRARGVPYRDAGGDTGGMPLGPASGKSGQAAASGSYLSPQQGSGAEVEDGGQSYHGYAANGYRDYYAAANQIGSSGISPGYGYPAGQASPQQQTIAYHASYACGEAQPGSSAAASPPAHLSHLSRRSSSTSGVAASTRLILALAYRADARPGGASMPVSRTSQYVSQPPETAPRRYNVAEEQGKNDRAEELVRTQASDDMVPMSLSAAQTEGAPEAAEKDGKHGTCGQRSAEVSTQVAPASAKSAEYKRQASSQQADAPIPEQTLRTREPLVSLELPPSSLNAPHPQQPPPQNAGEDSTTDRSDRVPKDAARSQQTSDRCMPPKGSVTAAAHDSGESSLSGAEDNADEEAEADYATETFMNSKRDTATSAMTAIPCLGTPFHTYICGAIVEQAAQLQTNACSSSATGGGTGIAAGSTGTPPASLSTAALAVRPAMYAPVQRLLSREMSRGACSATEERDRGLAQPSMVSGDVDAEGARACSEEDEGVRDLGGMKPATKPLTADALAAARVSSPSVPIQHHCHAYHGTSPFLQPASLASSCTAFLSAGGGAAANKYAQSPESGSSAALPPRLPSGGGGSTPHLHRAGGGSREGSGAAATMQQPPSMVSYPHRYPNQPSFDLDGGRCAVVMEGASGDAEDHLQYCYQGNNTRACNTTKLSLRQQQQQSTGAEAAISGRRAGPGVTSLTSSPATVVCGSTFLNTPSQSSLLLSNGATARPGSATPSPTIQQHQHQRIANSGGASRFATSPDGGGQQGSMNGPANNISSTGGSSHRVGSPAHNRYTSPTHTNGHHAGGSQINLQAGGRYPMPATRPPYIYEHHVGQELLLEEFHAAMRFNAASFGNIACLVDAFSPQVPVASDLEFPCNEDHCQLICTRGSRGLSSSPGGGSSQHGSAQGSRSSRGGTFLALQSEDARATGGAGHNSTGGGGGGQEGPALPPLRPAQADRTHYWDFSGPSYCEPVMTLKSIWQSFDSPFGCVVNLAEPIYPAPMRPAEGELVYTPLLSGFRIRFHPASPAYKRLTALREVRRQRRREEAAASESVGVSAEDEHATTGVEGVARGGGSSHTAGSYAEEDGVLTWSATDRPNNRNIIVEQIVELAKCDESYAELLTATTADVDHQSWVALMWQPVFCGGHSSKHSCGTFLAYYLLRAPRHLFVPFADKSEGAAMNSSWNSPVFRGDRAALSFDLWSLQRHYHVARWVSPPPMTHIMTALSVDGEDDEPDNGSSSCASTSRGRNSWEEGQTGCASNRTTESFAFSTNGDSRLRLRDAYMGSTGAGAVVGGESSSTTIAGAVAAPHTTTGTANAAACPTRAKASTYVRIPLVGLIPNRCRSEVWFKPVYDASLMDVHRHGGGSGGVMGGGDGVGAGASGVGAGMGASNGLGGAGGAAAALEAMWLMCWDAYNEWERKSPTCAAAAGRPSAFSEVRRDAGDSEAAIGGASEATAGAGTGGGNPSRGAATHRRNPWSSYVAKGVELMTDAARQYRAVREVANLDGSAEEGTSGCAVVFSSGGCAATTSEGCIGSAEEKRPVDGDKSVAKQQRGGCAVVAGGTSSSLCDPAARVIAGLLDYYQWAQYDTSLTALAAAYCAT
ncbi:hypothetical protein CGC20_5365 [Leishmania donovani]|uniref:Uncharacterized protein n=1 Tax=Leishmania donovani TaxID=5661 RepID=A0A504XTT8_LEIDO|nr:hypothetical protein CGC20_5365 [Leishmania donovani]